jgi:hypothetical protein
LEPVPVGGRIADREIDQPLDPDAGFSPALSPPSSVWSVMTEGGIAVGLNHATKQ